MTEWTPEWTVPPGEILREWMDEHHYSTQQLARRCIKWPHDKRLFIDYLKMIRSVLAGGAIGARDAEALGRATEIESSFWQSLETRHRAYIESQR